MFAITDIPADERKSWSKCKFYVIETGRDQHMSFVTRGQAAKYIAQREKAAAAEAAKAAEAEAARLARLAHPVGAAIETQRADTLVRVGQDFDAYVARMAQKIETAGGDLDVLAPCGNVRTDNTATYRSKNRLRNAYTALCKTDYNRPDHRVLVTLSDELVARARGIELEGASFQYDMFAAKLIGKIGDCDSALLEGTHVWGHSYLTVTKGADREVWKTQQILNRSVYGTLFNQWPSRKVG